MKKKKSSKVYVLALLVFIPLFCVSSYMVFSQLYVDHQQDQEFDSLAALVNQARNNPDMLAQTGSATTAAPVVTDASDQGMTTEPAAQDGSAATVAPAATEASVQNMSLPTPEPVDAIETSIPETTAEAIAETATPVVTATPVATETPVPPMLSAYEPLYKRNKDFFGWIEIEDTVVNYPVMHTPTRPEYYLHRSFERKDVYSGVPFLAGDCFIGCGNYLIYGHHIKNGTQFAGITKYSSEEFWEEHPTIRFDTLYEVGVYDVVAAFYSKVYPDSMTDVFRYYAYTDLREEAAFEEYVKQVMEVALYDTGIELEFGDQLITLSTCEYSQKDGRFVVVGRKR